MSVYLAAFAVCMTVGCFVVTAMVIGLEVRDHLAAQPEPTTSRVPVQRSAAAIVAVHNTQSFDEFLRELIATPHVEEALR